MRPAMQIVRHTMAIGVTGFPDILVNLLTMPGYRWYPQYTIYEVYCEFNQELYRTVVRIFDRQDRSTKEIHTFVGFGVTEEMSVQEAAFVAITHLRREYPRLEDTGFRYIPYAPAGDETAYYSAVCTPIVPRHYDPQHLVRYTEALDRSIRALTVELFVTRARLYDALTWLVPVVERGIQPVYCLFPSRTEFPLGVAWPALSGEIPARGPLLPDSMRSDTRVSTGCSQLRLRID